MNAPSPHVWTYLVPLSEAETVRCAHVSALVDEVHRAERALADLYVRQACGHTLAPTDFGIRELTKAADAAVWTARDALNKALLELADPDERHRLVDETDRLEPGNMGAALRHVVLSEGVAPARWADHEAGFGSFGSAA